VVVVSIELNVCSIDLDKLSFVKLRRHGQGWGIATLHGWLQKIKLTSNLVKCSEFLYFLALYVHLDFGVCI
jgi:hypothetical protein